MGPERFVAATAAEALKMVRQALGDEAMVISTKQTAEGVEIMAITPDALEKLSGQPAAPSRGVAPIGSGFEGDTYSGPRRAPTSPTPAFPHELVISDVIKPPKKNLDGSPVYSPEQLGTARPKESGASNAASAAAIAAAQAAVQAQAAAQASNAA